jgi:hypothetical protein
MDLLKQQIMLRKQALNPDMKGGNSDNSMKGNLA